MANILENLLGFVSPKLAFRRERYRVATEMLRGFEAASRSRRTANWKAGSLSANEENRSAISLLRNRSRDLFRNNPYAKRAIELLADNLIGSGIRPAPIGTTSRGEKKLKELWMRWADKTRCDWDGKHNFYGLQWLAAKTFFESGEVLIVRRRSTDKNLPVPIQLQVLEADYIDSLKDRLPTVGGGEIIQGVEYDKDGKRVAYWLYDRHPGDTWYSESRRVPATDILHVYPVERAGQVRGVPRGTSAMMRLKDFDEYEDAQLIRQKIAACFSIFLTQDDESSNGSNIDEFDKVEPGIIYKTKPGQEVSFATPPAAEGYDVYTRTVLRAIAMGYGVSYEAMTGDLSNVNFSSGRMGWIEFHRLITRLQELVFIPQFCDAVWDWFMDAAVLSLQIRETQKADATWTSPRREMIDPVKEVQGIREAIRTGIGSWQEAVRQLGYDPEQVLEELKKDKAAFDAAGLAFEWNPAVKVGSAGQQQPPQLPDPSEA